MRYKIIGDANISGNVKGDFFDAEPHAVEEYIRKGQIEEVAPQEKKPAEVVVKKPATVVVKKPTEREQIKKELKEAGIEFKGNAKTEVLKELLNKKK